MLNPSWHIVWLGLQCVLTFRRSIELKPVIKNQHPMCSRVVNTFCLGFFILSRFSPLFFTQTVGTWWYCRWEVVQGSPASGTTDPAQSRMRKLLYCNRVCFLWKPNKKVQNCSKTVREFFERTFSLTNFVFLHTKIQSGLDLLFSIKDPSSKSRFVTLLKANACTYL